MAQDASTIPPSGIGKLHISDFWKSVYLGIITNILLTLYPIISAGNWPTSADLHSMVKTTVAMVIAYLLKNLGTNNVGEFLKKDKPTIEVSAEKLEQKLDEAKK